MDWDNRDEEDDGKSEMVGLLVEDGGSQLHHLQAENPRQCNGGASSARVNLDGSPFQLAGNEYIHHFLWHL